MSKNQIIAVGAAVATTWATGKVVKALGVPAVAAPIVGLVVGKLVDDFAKRL